MNDTTNNNLCTYARAREELDVSERQLYKLISAGVLKRVKIKMPNAKRPMCRLTRKSVDACKAGAEVAAAPAVVTTSKRQTPAPPLPAKPRPTPGRVKPIPAFV